MTTTDDDVQPAPPPVEWSIRNLAKRWMDADQDRGRTHFVGCAFDHPMCALAVLATLVSRYPDAPLAEAEHTAAITRAVAQEREECAQIAYEHRRHFGPDDEQDIALDIAAAIRARTTPKGEETP